MVLMTKDSQLRRRDIEVFCDNHNSHALKSNSLDRKSWKVTLNNCDKDAEV